jgi:hypothetical protein
VDLSTPGGGTANEVTQSSLRHGLAIAFLVDEPELGGMIGFSNLWVCVTALESK